MTTSLARRVVVVTGASRRQGIGFATAQQLADAGAELFHYGYRAYDAGQVIRSAGGA